MLLVGEPILATFAQRHADARSSLSAWAAEVKAAHWASPVELQRRYPRASVLGHGDVVFDIRSGYYRLHVRVNYLKGVVAVIRIGTHAEYDRWTF